MSNKKKTIQFYTAPTRIEFLVTSTSNQNFLYSTKRKALYAYVCSVYTPTRRVLLILDTAKIQLNVYLYDNSLYSSVQFFTGDNNFFSMLHAYFLLIKHRK